MRYQFANYKSVVISPEAPNTITSTIEASSIRGRITDVNISVDVDHSFTADLEISLIGPDSTRVLLVGEEGGWEDNFTDTVFDDHAEYLITEAIPPFTGTFRPEEGLDAFNNSDPNGTWTLEIKDDAFRDGGELKRWFLDIEVAESEPDTLVFRSENPVQIVSDRPNTVLSTIHVTGHQERLLQRARVTVDIAHSFVQDLTLTLISPDKTRIVLADKVGGGQENYESTVFADEADTSIRKGKAPFKGEFRPEIPLAELTGRPVAGAWRLEVRDQESGDGGTLKFWSLQLETLSRELPAESQFQIEVEFLGGLSATQKAVFQDAATRWSKIIVGDLPEAVTDSGRVVDDVLILAQGQDIDGAGGPDGNVLGQARPVLLREGSRLPITGVMTFDTYDLESMESDGTLLDVIVHEMGHVLGIGTLWSYFGLLQGAAGNDPVFTGAQAMAEYAQLSGNDEQRPVPVANTGGPGTRNGHWRESVFDTELMTGYIDAGVKNPISRITAASLSDLGYEVNRGGADAYALPGPASMRAETSIRRGCLTLHERIELRELTANASIQEVTVGENLSWSVKLASASGVTVRDSGAVNGEAVLTAPARLPKNMQDAKELTLQLSNVDSIEVLLITSTVYDENVEIKADKDLVKLTGPLMLFGNSIKQFAGSLDKLTVQNKSQDEEAELHILIGRKLTS